MATTQSATAADLTDELIAAMPEGFGDLMDLNDPDGPGPLFGALGQILKQVGTDQVDDLRDQLSPLSCSMETLSLWEAALGLAFSRLARAGSDAARRAQVIARLREWGAPTRDLIKRVVYTYLGYSSPMDVVILESDRAALRALHTYSWKGVRALGPTLVDFQVLDGGTVGPGGAQVDLSLKVSDLNTITVSLTSPDGTVYSRTGLGRGASEDQRAWKSVTSGTNKSLNGVWAASETLAWSVGDNGTILKWDGTSWAAAASGVTDNLNSVHGSDPSNVWAVGASGTIMYYDPGGWGTFASGVVTDLTGVWLVSSSCAYAVGVGGVILKFNGASWSAQTSGTVVNLYGVWAADSSNVWVVGDNGTILRTTDGGTTWTSESSGTTESLRGIRGTSPGDIWAVGTTGTALRRTPAEVWVSVGTGIGDTLRAVAPDGALPPVAFPTSGNVWAVGQAGRILITEPGQPFGLVASVPLTDFKSIWVLSPGSAWAVGSPGRIRRLLDTGSGVRVYFPEVEGEDIFGTWTVTVSGSGTLSQIDLFVEGAGLDSGGASGRGTAASWWGVMFEEAKSSGDYDLDAARLAVARLTMACRWSNILRRSSGAGALPAGQYGAIPGDPGALPGAAVPGVAV